MTEQDADLVTPKQRTSLLQHINLKTWNRDPELVIALLRGAEQWKNTHVLASIHLIAALNPRRYPHNELITEVRSAVIRLERILLAEEISLQFEKADVPLKSTENQTESEPLFSQEALERISKLNVDTQERNPGMRIGFLLATWLIIVPYTGFQAVMGLLDKNPLQGVCFTILMLLSTQLYRLTLSKKQSEAAYKLALTNDINAVGSLAEMLDWPDTELSGAASRALTHLLPRLNASHAHLLYDGQRQSLYRRLKKSIAVQNIGFSLEVLKALEQIGDMSAVPYVEKLAENIAISHNESRLREAAIQCLPFLKIRAECTHNTQTLLRASSAELTPQEMLLRPVYNITEAFPEQLLRAASLQDDL